MIWVLMILAGHLGINTVAFQEFNTKEACMAAAEHAHYGGYVRVAVCVPKGERQ